MNKTARAPFLGLRFFDQDDADLLCGRDEQVDELLDKLARRRFVTVIGPSGCGKSSLVRAGLMPALQRMDSWRIVTMRPGGDPIGELAAVLERTFHASGIELTLRRGRDGLAEAVRQCRLDPGENFLLIVDQFEELFRFQGREDLSDDSAAFVKLILEATQIAAGTCALITMRSDYLGDCARFSDLPERINEGLYLVPRMRRDQLEQAIIGPLRVSGDPIAPRLTQCLLNDLGDDPDQLPVLQHALLRTWTRWRETDGDGPIDLAHYHDEVVGGLSQTLQNHAEQIFAGLSPSRREVASILFRRLTEIDETRAIRRPSTFEELVNICGGESRTEEVREVVDAFRADGVSFLTPEAHRPLQQRTVVDITHESLIRQWSRLREWAEQEEIDRGLYLQLARRAVDASGQEDNLTGSQLASATGWLRKGLNASWAKRYGGDYERTLRYIQESAQAAADAVEAAKDRLRLFMLFVMIGLFVVCLEADDLVMVFAGAAIVVAWQVWREARPQKLLAEKGETG